MKYGRNIMIFASEVPVISAMNPFRKIEDVFFDVWKRTNAKQVASLQEQLQLTLPTQDEQIASLVRGLGAEAAVQSLVQQAAAAETTEKVVEATTRIAQALPESTPDEVKREVVQHITSQMQKTFGVQAEAPAIKEYEQKHKVVVQDKNLVFSKKKLAAVGKYDVLLGGKIDGRADGRVVEVKNRMKKFMTPLPKYDIAQLQTYLFILGVREGELVEHLRSNAAETKTTKVEWDPAMWDTEIAPFVLQFSSALSHFMRDEQAQVQYLKGEAPVRKEIIRTHWLKEKIRTS